MVWSTIIKCRVFRSLFYWTLSKMDLILFAVLKTCFTSKKGFILFSVDLVLEVILRVCFKKYLLNFWWSQWKHICFLKWKRCCNDFFNTTLRVFVTLLNHKIQCNVSHCNWIVLPRDNAVILFEITIFKLYKVISDRHLA